MGELENHRLQVGVSTKSEVVNAIGLPRKTNVDEKSGQEIWYYTGRPISKSYFIPLPVAAISTSPNTQTVYWSDIGQKNIVGNDPVVLSCVFDRSGHLIFVK